MAGKTKTDRVPAEKQQLFADVTGLTDGFCKEFLTDEYAVLCRQLAAALCRKRPSPLERGGLAAWAAGIVYALGSVNFLHDRSQDPHMPLQDIGPQFGVGPTTAAAKAKEIRRLLRMRQFDPRWGLPSQLDTHPLAWMIEVNGFPVDARYMPRTIQEEAFRKGYIPYVPGTKEG